MVYLDDLAVELGDSVQVYRDTVGRDPELATVIKIGKLKIKVEYVNTFVRPRKEFVYPGRCDLIAREN